MRTLLHTARTHRPCRYVWITRSAPGCRQDARILSGAGAAVICSPLTTVRLLPDAVQTISAHPEHALLFTSPNAVRALTALSASDKAMRTVYVSGRSTFRRAIAAGFARAVYTGGVGADTVRYMAQHPSEIPFIHCSGDHIRTDIAVTIPDGRRIAVYNSASASVHPRHIALLQAGCVAGVCFSSVQAARLWKKQFVTHEPVAMRGKPAYYCLSQEIADIFPGDSFRVKIAPHPFPAALCRSVLRDVRKKTIRIIP